MVFAECCFQDFGFRG